MLPVALTTGAAAVVWTTLLVRWLGLYGCCITLVVVASCFGYDFYHVSIGPLPLSADRVMLGALCALYVVQRSLQIQRGRPLDRTDWMLIVFVAILSASTMLHDWRWRDSQPLASLLFLYMVPVALYWLVRESVHGEKAINALFTLLAVFGIYLSLTAIAEVMQLYSFVFPRYIITTSYTEWMGRARGPFINPTTNGSFLAAAIFSWATFWPRAKGLGRMIVLGGMLLCLIGVLCTLTRSCWLGAAMGLALMVFVTMPRHFRVPTLIIGGVLSGMLLTIGKDNLKSFKRDKNVSQYHMEQSAKLRPILAEVAWRVFRDHPMFGVGYGQYKRVDVNYWRAPDAELPLEVAKGFVQHNLFLGVLVDTGLVGLSAYLALLAAWSWRSWRLWNDVSLPLAYRQLGLVVLAFLVQWSINGMFHDVALPTNSNLLLLLMAGTMQGAWLERPRTARRAADRRGIPVGSVGQPAGQTSLTAPLPSSI